MRFKKKCLVVFFSVLILTSLVGTKAMAVDTDALRVRIAALQAQIAVLMQQLDEAVPQQAVWCHDFNTKMGMGDSGDEVAALNMALRKEGFTFERKMTIGGQRSFDAETASAVTGFQQKYHSDTLAPWGLKYGTGYAGRTTLAKLTAIYGCDAQPVDCTADVKQCPDGSYVSRVAPSCVFKECPTTGCIKEGEEGSTECGDTSCYQYCCPGLTKISTTKLYGDICEGGVNNPGNFICAYCGNGVCGFGENSCNCPADCPTQVVGPSVTVISPNGGEGWQIGQTYTISWKTNLPASYKTLYIDLVEPSPSGTMQGGDFMYVVYSIAKAYPIFLSNYTWTIPASIPVSSKYKIRVSTIGNDAGDLSDNYFSVVDTSSCTQEGDIKCNVTGCKSCCEGLVEREVLTQTKDSFGELVCAEEMTQTVCVNCGNGVCGLGENSCNCSTDCPGGVEENLPPVLGISTVPVMLRVNQQGTWEIKVYDPENGPLSYAINWGDRFTSRVTDEESPASSIGQISQVSTFTHTYSQAGTYTVKFTITDDHQQSVETSYTISVVGSSVACSDTDGGKNYYSKGTVIDLGKKYTDYCIPATAYSSAKLIEYWCRDKSRLAVTLFNCSGDCYAGACVNIVKTPDLSVTKLEVAKNGADTVKISYCIKNIGDADSGNFSIQLYNLDNISWAFGGSVLNSFSPEKEHCSGATRSGVGANGGNGYVKGANRIKLVVDSKNEVAESNEINNELIYSFNTNQFSTCADTDGGKDYYTKGSITTYGSITQTDHCIEGGYLKEYHCLDDPGGSMFTYSCPYGCENGECITQAGQNFPPVIDGLTAPTQLMIGEQGTWKIEVHDPENGTLSYHINWGDNSASSMIKTSAYSVAASQTSIFRHTYNKAGTYTVKFTITDDNQQSVDAAATVGVGNFSCLQDGEGSLQPNVLRACCSGLQLLYSTDNYDSSCVKKSTGFFYNAVCTPCGDGVCGQNENSCNCPADCPTEVEEKSITVTSPSEAGKQLQLGGSYIVTWETSGDIGNYVRVAILKNGQVIDQLGAGGVNNTGSFLWVVRSSYSVGADYKVKIYAVDNPSIYDLSDNYFSIVDSVVSTCTDSDGGKDYYTKGYVTSGNTTTYDNCANTQRLNEAVCAINGNPEFVSFECPGGCDNGACAEAVAEVGSLYVAIDASNPLSQEVVEEIVGFTFLKIAFTAGSAEDINVNSISVYARKIFDNTVLAVDSNDVMNIGIYDGDIRLGYLVASPSSNGAATFSAVNWVIPKSTTKVLTVKADVVSAAVAEKILFALDTESTKATGVDSGASISIDDSDSSITGHWMTIAASSSGILSPCGNFGDVDGDGYVTEADSDLVLNYGVGNITLTSEQIARADVSGNGTVSAYDSALILQYIDGTITTFSACALGGLNNMENQLANISSAAAALAEKIKELLGR